MFAHVSLLILPCASLLAQRQDHFQASSASKMHLVVVGNVANACSYGAKKGIECLPDTSVSSMVNNSYGNKLGVTCCSVSGAGTRPGCKEAATFSEARDHCETYRLRLCTRVELERGAGVDTGCNFNAYSNWVSDPCDATNMHFVVVGNVALDGAWGAKKGLECLPDLSVSNSVVNSNGNKLGVTCCDDSGVGSRPDCKEEATFLEAKGHCECKGLRLCTKAEIEGGAGVDTGCQFNSYSNWVSDACGATRMHFVVVGDVASDGSWGAKKGVECLPDTSVSSTVTNSHGNKLGVTCCSVSGAGTRPDCKEAATFPEARDHCEANGLRLCTKVEIEGGAGAGTGCNFNAYSNWVSDPCEA